MLLAIDTSTRFVGVALYNGVQVVSEEIWLSRDHHTVELAPAVAQALSRAGLSVPGLQALAVALGPGSFTGLRIGLALAKGMALAGNLPLIGIPTLDVLAASQPVIAAPMVAVLRAGRGRLAIGHYRVEKGAWRAQGENEVLTFEVLATRFTEPTLVCGELTEEERRQLQRKRKNVILASPAQSLRRPSFLAEMAWVRWQSGLLDDPATLAPVYIHYSNAIPGI
jgi:tRNA threonylcarbamoyladenosine biosynthesis protein TsaB